MKDTPDEVTRRYEAMLLAIPPGRRVAMALRMFDTARLLAEAGLRAAGVTDPREIRRRLLVAFYGDEVGARDDRGGPTAPPRPAGRGHRRGGPRTSG